MWWKPGCGLLLLWPMLPHNQQYTVEPGPSSRVTAKTMSPSVPLRTLPMASGSGKAGAGYQLSCL
eukprot:2988307-Amphidinium_carterae.1